MKVDMTGSWKINLEFTHQSPIQCLIIILPQVLRLSWNFGQRIFSVWRRCHVFSFIFCCSWKATVHWILLFIHSDMFPWCIVPDWSTKCSPTCHVKWKSQKCSLKHKILQNIKRTKYNNDGIDIIWCAMIFLLSNQISKTYTMYRKTIGQRRRQMENYK